MHVIARTSDSPSSLAPAVIDEIRNLDNEEPASEIRTMDDVISRSFSNARIPGLLLGSFAALGLAVAGLGIYGSVSYTVNQQRAEIGIRMALGAARFNILKSMIGHTMFVAAIGILIGLLGTMAAARILEASVFGITAISKSTVSFVVLFVSSVTLVAAYLPARKAATMDPVRALKCE